MPREASPEFIDQPSWQVQVTSLNARLPSLPLATRRLVFIGDSITASWDPAVFNQYYGNRAPLLLGISGDYTQGVLERLPVEWGPMQPRLAIVLIGTNNTRWGGGKPENVALGVAEIVRMIHAKSSGTRVLLLGILPTGAEASDPLRAVNARVNDIIARCADNDTTFYMDPGPSLLDANGHLADSVSFDMLHLTPLGYAMLAKAIEPQVQQIMGE
jgi:beta-glucosidase